jgi:hypothetical protein
MSKQPLTITCIESSGDFLSTPFGATYCLQINPSEFSHERTICYNTRRVPGQVKNPTRFNAINPDTLSFSVVFDGTGVVPPVIGVQLEVAVQIEALSRIIYDYDSEAHEPNHVLIGWGTMIFTGRLQSISTSYTLFKSSGAPLRARSNLVFKGSATITEALLLANRSSPDLSHSVTVIAGDTLPLLCQRVYGDSRYYPEVAAFNGLREFRRLQPGARLHFPPLK